MTLYELVRPCTTQYNSAVTTTSASEARASLPALLTRAEAGEVVTITRHGRPVAVLVSPDALRSSRSAAAFVEAEGLAQALTAAAQAPAPPGPVLSVDRAEELVDSLRRERERG